MTRDLDSTMLAALPAPVIMPCWLVQLTFASESVAAWSGVGSLTYNGVTYLGVGSLGSVGPIAEGSDVKADGTTLTLSGIDPVYLNECLADIRLGAPASIYFGLYSTATATLIGTPYLIFQGTVDKPMVHVGTDTISITLALENKLINLGRASQQRYTAADQHLSYPDDTGLNWVEILNDIALRWGS